MNVPDCIQLFMDALNINLVLVTKSTEKKTEVLWNFGLRRRAEMSDTHYLHQCRFNRFALFVCDAFECIRVILNVHSKSFLCTSGINGGLFASLFKMLYLLLLWFKLNSINTETRCLREICGERSWDIPGGFLPYSGCYKACQSTRHFDFLQLNYMIYSR